MVKHNNALPNVHLRKHWGKFVRTWFDQPARAKKRANIRKVKASIAFPRPATRLRPVVRCKTIKYNSKLRFGKGFTKEELKAAGLTPQFAKTVGISYDHRRTNANEDSFKVNVDRLNEYKENLVLFPLKKDKYRKGEIADSTAEQIKKVYEDQELNLTKNIIELPKESKREKKVAVTDELLKKRAVQQFKQAKIDHKYSRRRHLAKLEAEQKAKDGK